MVQKAVEAAVVAATKRILLALMCLGTTAQAAVLPEERADAMYHRYDGGGVTIDGPSVLVRKNFKETVSVSANYYVDNISSASIDVEVLASSASSYGEKRTEYSVGADYLYGKSLLSAGYTNSDENDYSADTYYFSVSQDFFGDLTNLSFGYSRGEDDVFQTGNEEFAEEVTTNAFRLGLSQIITPNLIAGFNYESISNEGWLNNPYRAYRYLNNPLDPNAGYSFSQEVYPETRTSDAASLRFKYYLPWRATFGAGYRYYTDDWGIDSHDASIGYTHVFFDALFVDVQYRYMDQTAADFYADLFLVQSQDEKDYRARDKELSEANNQTFSLHVSYEQRFKSRFVDKAALSVQWDHIMFEYDNFTDLRNPDAAVTPGDEELYDFAADVFKVLFTVWY